MVIIWILVGIVVLGALFLWATYNGLVRLNERVNEAWSDITVQLKYRADLIPNVVESVKGYAKHERDAFESVTKARTSVMSAKSVKETAAAENALESGLGRLMAIAESYPELKANTNFMDLQQKLQDTEDKIQAARRFYNNGAKDLNTKIKTFPTNVFARKLGFAVRDYFEVKDRAAIENAPEVKF
ncbi:MAG: LemA family protein [Candidatus Nomurabacteria bacterium]|jgi:LemA protein|nr:LemA family protein [Candidatus Nomurabacteria bacterium]